MRSFICNDIVSRENKQIRLNFQINISLTTLEAHKLLSVFYGVLSVDNARKNALPSPYIQQYWCYCYEP